MMPSLLLPFFSHIVIALVVPLVHPSFWTRWQHVLLVHVHGVVLSRQLLMGDEYLLHSARAWPSSSGSPPHPRAGAGRLRWITEDGQATTSMLGIAVGSCPRWTKIPLLQGKIHFRHKGKPEEC